MDVRRRAIPMAVEHIVLFTWARQLSKAQVAAQVEMVEGLRGHIPGLTDLKSGQVYRQAPAGADWDYAVLMVFTAKADLDRWAVAPEHEVFAGKFMPGVAKYLVVDFER